jgi:FRG domain
VETKQVESWAQLLEVLEDIQRQYSKFKIEEYEQRNLILYRGLSDNSWPLSTTLERQSSRAWTIKSYYRRIYFSAREIESFLATSWNLKPMEEMDKYFAELVSDITVDLPHYEYWAYLRHHGFPSPLLDWTKSPYIALFFALCDQSNATEASLYAYIETPLGSKGGIAGAPMITVLYPYVRTHKRHFLQQSHYTIATKLTKDEKNDRTFVPHETVFAEGQVRQDVLIKIVIPRSLRLEILNKLETYNINFYSLFQSEDALVKSLGLKMFELLS